MGRCRECGFEVLDETEYCPLCQSILEYTEELENMYPDVSVRIRRLNRVSHIYLFCALLTQAVLLGINWVTGAEIWWSAISGVAFLYVYLVLRYAILGKAGYRSKVIVLASLAVLLSVVSDIALGYRGWSVNYVLPAGILLMDIIILGCMIYNRRNWQSYMMWQLFMILCSLIPVGLYFSELEQHAHMAFLPLAASCTIFLGTLIVGDRRARMELLRRFHI